MESGRAVLDVVDVLVEPPEVVGAGDGVVEMMATITIRLRLIPLNHPNGLARDNHNNKAINSGDQAFGPVLRPALQLVISLAVEMQPARLILKSEVRAGRTEAAAAGGQVALSLQVLGTRVRDSEILEEDDDANHDTQKLLSSDCIQACFSCLVTMRTALQGRTCRLLVQMLMLTMCIYTNTPLTSISACNDCLNVNVLASIGRLKF